MSEPKILAECWTCYGPNDIERGKTPLPLFGEDAADQIDHPSYHRAAGHDVRTIAPSEK